VVDVEMDIAPRTSITAEDTQLLPPPISPPTPPRSAPLNSGFGGPKGFEFISTESKHTPHTPGNVSFNLNEFINVSPSPAAPRGASSMPPPRMDVGRKLFGDEHHLKGIMADSIRPPNPGRGSYLGAGIDFVRT
jgi:hypothetical protein